ncbi:hypothetical protein ACWGB8_02705 [Kitasatospora sp. NPDC054939]
MSAERRTGDGWTADYWFHNILTQRRAEGRTTADSFEALAVSLIATASDVVGRDTEPLHAFGETLLRTARLAAQLRGHWEYSPTGCHEWADVTVTRHAWEP